MQVFGGFSGTETTRNGHRLDPASTVIDGQNARRCVVAALSSSINGFTLMNGVNGDHGGGLYGGTATNCFFRGNSTQIGGGAFRSTVINCLFVGNSATVYGGGMADGTAINCTFAGNTVTGYSLCNHYYGCTWYDGAGGGAGNGTLSNCILWNNSPNDVSGDTAVSYSCLSTAVSGMGNIAANPRFMDEAFGNLQLQPGSPCIDMGTGAKAPPADMFGVPRPQGANYDMGAYEVAVPVIVPELFGLVRAAAQELVAAAQLYVGKESEEYHSTIPNDQVIRQTPAAGTQVMQRTPVDLVISKGPEPVSVPDVVGQTQDAAAVLIAGANLAVGAVTQQHSLTVPTGNVISQSPVQGAQVLPGAAVDLAVSCGGIAVPDVVGQIQGNASAAISSAGLVVVTVTQQYSATVPVGKVISQAPAAGSAVLPSAAAYLVVSRGVQPSVMPNVAGQTRAQAELALTGVGFVLGSVTLSHSVDVPAGAVVAQSPAAGTELPPGTVVSIVVSLGAAPLPEGEGEALNTDAARQQLAAAYASADSNSDGGLSFGEAAAVVPGLPQAVFDGLDVNHDGRLTADELGMGEGSGCVGCRSGKSAVSTADYGKRAADLFLTSLAFLGLAVMAMLRRP